jgi:hypothetical protein
MRGSLSFSIERGTIFIYCAASERRGDQGHYTVRSPYPPDALPEAVERVDSGHTIGTERFDIDLPDDVPHDLSGSRIILQLELRAGPRIASAPVRVALEIRGRPHGIETRIPLHVLGDQTRITPTTLEIHGMLQAHNVNPDTGMPGYSPPYVPVFPVISGPDDPS